MLYFCRSYGILLVKKQKAKFMMINVNIEDRKPLQIGGIEVGYIHNYIPRQRRLR